MDKAIRSDLRKYSNKEKAIFLPKFFNCKDKFLGVSVPDCRQIARKYKKFTPLQALLKSKIHEERLVALMILIEKFKYNP